MLFHDYMLFQDINTIPLQPSLRSVTLSFFKLGHQLSCSVLKICSRGSKATKNQRDRANAPTKLKEVHRVHLPPL